ncbi:MAG: hypothetical protein PHV23_01505 [Candidatus Gracilibacteria bacterium]|nr:hypothetical protein [Candidatus Gracilibacteria bacterium]
MKKIIIATIVGSALFTSGTFADYLAEPMLISEPTSVVSSDTTSYLANKYDIIIRNNFLDSDYDYNNMNYYTSKIKAENIVIPDEIKTSAKKIYFLIEEGNSRIYNTFDYARDESMKVENVTDEYNYKIVEYKEGQKEYIFKNSDLVKDFTKDEYKSVTITLMAEISDSEKIPLSTSAYNYINTKEEVLQQLISDGKGYDYYYTYFNSDNLEKYLITIGEKNSRSEYKNILNKIINKVSQAKKLNDDNGKNILANIKLESDFKNNLDKYELFNETKNLLDSLDIASKNQIQNIKAFDAIDTLLK